MEIFQHRQIIIEGEFLRHITDDLFDFLRFFDDTKSCHLPFSRGRDQETTKYSDRGGFPCPVGPEKSEDLSSLHLKMDVVHGNKRAEVLNEIFHFNRKIIHKNSMQSEKLALQNVKCFNANSAIYNFHFELIIDHFLLSLTNDTKASSREGLTAINPSICIPSLFITSRIALSPSWGSSTRT